LETSSFQKAGSKLDVIHRRLKKQPNVQHLILYHPEVVSVSTLEESIRHSDRSLTKALGKAFFDYGQLSKLILEMPIRSWNSKFSVNTSPFRLIAHRMSLPGSATIFHFWVISTDYKNYALVWSCDALCDEFKREQLWLLSREPTLSDEIWQNIKARYFTNGPFKLEYLFPVSQDNCPKMNKIKNAGMKSEFNVLSLIQFK